MPEAMKCPKCDRDPECSFCKGAGTIEVEPVFELDVDNPCESHSKSYDDAVLYSSPPQIIWTCSECDAQGRDRVVSLGIQVLKGIKAVRKRPAIYQTKSRVLAAGYLLGKGDVEGARKVLPDEPDAWLEHLFSTLEHEEQSAGETGEEFCTNCGVDKIVCISADCADRCSMSGFIQGKFVEDMGYPPQIEGLLNGEMVDACVCLECGQVQGEWPQPLPDVLFDQLTGKT